MEIRFVVHVPHIEHMGIWEITIFLLNYCQVTIQLHRIGRQLSQAQGLQRFFSHEIVEFLPVVLWWFILSSLFVWGGYYTSGEINDV